MPGGASKMDFGGYPDIACGFFVLWRHIPFAFIVLILTH
jgi:hypothetical protein